MSAKNTIANTILIYEKKIHMTVFGCIAIRECCMYISLLVIVTVSYQLQKKKHSILHGI